MPTDPADENNAGKFLDYLESTLDGEISPYVRVYELEDVKERTEETIDVVIDHICHLAHPAVIDDGSDAAVEIEVQCRLVHAIPDSNIELQKELLKVGLTSTRDLSYILCHQVWSCYNVCWQNHQAVKKSHQPQ